MQCVYDFNAPNDALRSCIPRGKRKLMIRAIYIIVEIYEHIFLALR